MITPSPGSGRGRTKEKHVVLKSSLPRRSAVALLAGVALVVTGCGGGSSDTSSGGSKSAAPSVSADKDLAAKVPDKIASDGKLTVGSDTSYAPSEFIDADGQTIVGFDVDLFKAVAQKLGLEADFQTASFDSIIAGVGSGKYEVGVSSFTVNPDRMKQANMISYYSAGTQWATKKDNPEKVDVEDACGLSIAVQKATVQVDDITVRVAHRIESKGKTSRVTFAVEVEGPGAEEVGKMVSGDFPEVLAALAKKAEAAR